MTLEVLSHSEYTNMQASPIAACDGNTSAYTTFDEMLDSSNGNVAQLAAVEWIRPRNPEKTIQLMESLGVDIFQKAAIKTTSLLRGGGKQSNHTLPDISVNSLVDFALNKTSFNEAVHLGALVINSAIIAAGIANGHIDVVVAANIGVFAFNAYCVLAQKYTRARLSLTIDKALKRNKPFYPEEVTNILGICFHESPNSESK